MKVYHLYGVIKIGGTNKKLPDGASLIRDNLSKSEAYDLYETLTDRLQLEAISNVLLDKISMSQLQQIRDILTPSKPLILDRQFIVLTEEELRKREEYFHQCMEGTAEI